MERRTERSGARERKRETGTIVIFPARDSARRKRNAQRGRRVTSGDGETSFESVGKKSPKSGSKM